MNQPVVFVTYDLFSAVLKEGGTRRSIANKYGCSEGSVQRIRKVKNAVDRLDTAELKRVCEREKLPAWALEFGKREIKHRKEEERKEKQPAKKGLFGRMKKPVPAEPVEKAEAIIPNGSVIVRDGALYDLLNDLITAVNQDNIDTNKSLDDILQAAMRAEKLLTEIKDVLIRIEYNTRSIK